MVIYVKKEAQQSIPDRWLLVVSPPSRFLLANFFLSSRYFLYSQTSSTQASAKNSKASLQPQLQASPQEAFGRVELETKEMKMQVKACFHVTQFLL